MQELHEADLAASVAQEQLTHERQRTGRLKQAIKSAFEDARTPAAGLIVGYRPVCWYSNGYETQTHIGLAVMLCGGSEDWEEGSYSASEHAY